MAGVKFCASAMVLFVLGAIVLGASVGNVVAAKACPLYCLDVEFMTCKYSGEKKLAAACNCCLAPKNCTLHLADGTLIPCH